MNKDSIIVLQKCISGCKMAVKSMDQLVEYTEDKNLRHTIMLYKKKHDDIKEQCTDLLPEAYEKTEEPGVISSTVSWFTIEMKMIVKNDNHNITKILMNGCNTGIQSLSQDLNNHPDASEQASRMVRHLIQLEEKFIDDLKSFI